MNGIDLLLACIALAAIAWTLGKLIDEWGRDE